MQLNRMLLDLHTSGNSSSSYNRLCKEVDFAMPLRGNLLKLELINENGPKIS